jgi:Fe-S oxidoreductase/nitrate reductase gamma subunit
MTPHREIGWFITIGGYEYWWVLYILATVAIVSIGYAVYKRYHLWHLGKPENRYDKPVERIKSFLTTTLLDGFLHRRFLRFGTRGDPTLFRPRELLPGLMHLLIFGGCMFLLLGALVDFVSHYLHTYDFMKGNVYYAFSFLNDFGGVLILIGLILAFVRRYIQRPDRLDNKWDDAIALGLIFFVVLTGFILEGFRIAAASSNAPGELALPGWESWGFLGYAFSKAFDNLSASSQLGWYRGLWWFHVILVIGAMIYISLWFSKLTHILVAPINVFFRSMRPKGALAPIDLETAETFGVSKIEDFTWKQLLDLDACTHCGRCQDNCPAYLSGKPLSPMKLIENLKAHLLERSPVLSKGKRGNGGDPDNGCEVALIGDVVTKDELWFCTTCRACQEACPVFVEHIDKIIDMRRNLVLEQAKVPETAEVILRSIEARGHSCRGTTLTRTDWTVGLDIKVLSEDSDVDILYWTGCAAALEERNTKVAIAFAKILKAAGVSFGILGVEESCCGEPARRMGNEYLFQMQAAKNIEILRSYNVRRIVTACPHCFNTLKHEYPQFGGDFEVIHHTQFIAQLIREGKLKLSEGTNAIITYHDSCYLGRHNSIYEAPREILRNIPEVQAAEMAHSRDRGICCGGGGGRFWMEERVGRRISEMRTDEVIDTGAGIVATACPYCLQMFEDAIKSKGVEESLTVMDLVELVEKSTR